ncbi:MAG: hypothetical protein COS17_10090 [Elusimicrobia bacterium CG02_land_8_20_14_3_00_37_13]|nr:MAG: hypothetical protein COS17_10090 [Elusimicrobia bacterium CG02_land_8_20_14_3_00_37_13]
MIKNNKGIALAMVILILLVGMIFISTLVINLTQDSRATIKQKRSMTAFHLAEAGADRAIYKLKSLEQYWNMASSGTPITGYNADIIHTDIEGGSYMMKVFPGTSTETTTEVVVIASGMDDMNKEVRTILVILQKDKGIPASISAPGVTLGGNADVHWGPMYSRGDLALSGSVSGNLYPRKWASGSITPRDTNASSEPNEGVGNPGFVQLPGTTWEPGWWEWKSYDPNVPEYDIDLDYYVQIASAQGKYFTYSSNTNFSDPNDSAAGGGNLNIVRYIKFTTTGKRLTIAGSAFYSGTFIVDFPGGNGTLKLTGTGAGNYNNYPVPDNAWEQYCAIDTSASGQWPGDPGGGPPSDGASTYNFSGVKFHGFVYLVGSYDATGNTLIHGTIIVTKNVSDSGGNTSVFYDPVVGAMVNSESDIQKIKWEEILPVWPLTP